MGEGKGKVVDLARFREQGGIVSERLTEVMNAGPFRSFILADGTVELAVDGELEDGAPIVVSVFIAHDNMAELVRGLLATSHQQDLRLKHLRSADRWIAKPHPSSTTTRLITFDDIERPFHRVVAGKRSGLARAKETIGTCGSRRQIECTEFNTSGPSTRAHWHCTNCGGCLVAGAWMWVEGKPPNGLSRAWPDAKLCDACATPTKDGLTLAPIPLAT